MWETSLVTAYSTYRQCFLIETNTLHLSFAKYYFRTNTNLDLRQGLANAWYATFASYAYLLGKECQEIGITSESCIPCIGTQQTPVWTPGTPTLSLKSTLVVEKFLVKWSVNSNICIIWTLLFRMRKNV